MAFVNEPLSEEQKSTFDIDVFGDPRLIFNKRLNFYRWVVDRERDIFMVCIGGGGPEGGGNAPYAPYYMVLSLKGHLIKFVNRYRAEGEGRIGGEKMSLFVTVEIAEIPAALESERNSILQLIREAIDAAGSSSYNRDCFVTVDVSIKN